MSHPAAWQPDPTGKHDHRWWDGERWTEHVADAGQASIDPLETGPPAADTGPTAGSPDAGAGEASPGGWAQGATEQGRDPDAGAGGTDPAWSQPGGPSGPQPQPGQPSAGWGAGGQQAGAPAWQGAQDPAWGGGGQPGAPAGAGGAPGGPVWGQAGQQPGGPAWQGGGGAAAPGTDGIAVAALIVGILAIVLFWFPVIGAMVGVVALVLGFVGRSRIKRSGASGKGMAVTGIVLGVITVLIQVAFLAFIIVAGEGFFSEFGSYVECMEETGNEELCQQEFEEGLIGRFGN